MSTTEVKKEAIPDLADVKPLSEDDVLNEMKALNSIPPDQMNKIINNYTNALAAMLTMSVENTSEEEQIVELEQIKRIMGLCPSVEKFIRSKDKVWGARKHILDRNADYFMNKDYGKLIKKDANQAFIESIIELIKDRYDNMEKKELDFYWDKATVMLRCVATFKKAMRTLSKK
jgi:hypothetical protein